MKSKFLAAILTLLAFSACHDKQARWQFQKTIDLGETQPIGIVKDNDHLRISDAGNNRIITLDKEGNITEEFTGFQRPMHLAYHNNKLYIPEFLTDTIKILNKGTISYLSLLKKPDAPAAIDVNKNQIAVADFYNHRIIFQQSNKAITISKKGHHEGELYYPTDVKIFNNLLYVADAYNNRVQVFDLKGQYVEMTGWNDSIKVASGIDVTKDYIAVTDQENNRALIYNHKGELLQTIHEQIDYPAEILIHGDELYVVNFQGKSVCYFLKE